MTTEAKQAISYDEAWRLASAATWRFASYYKFKFTFGACVERKELTAVIGDGTADAAYRTRVTSVPVTWEEVAGVGECHLRILGEHHEVLWEGWPL